MIRSCIFLLLLVVQRFFCLNCPDLYVPVKSEEICIHMTSRSMAVKNLPEYCKDEAQGGEPLNRRFTDEGLKEVGRIIKSLVESLFPEKVYIGMKRENQYGSNPDDFIYENSEGIVKKDDYPLWNDEVQFYDCGMVNYRKNFTVQPVSCSESAIFICEKKEMPCDSDSIRYLMYHGRCLYLYPYKDYSYSYVVSICDGIKGHVATYKSWKESSSIAEVIFNGLTLDGGLYAALKKTKSGDWEYDSGEQETSRWDPDDEQEWDCGVYRFVKNLTFGLYTMSCDLQLKGLCQYKGDV